MPYRTDIYSILAVSAGLLMSLPCQAQTTELAAVDLFPGVAFAGEGGLELTSGANGQQVATFWRPVQFNNRGELVAGRMDCKAAAQLDRYRPVLFNGEQVYEAQVAQGRLDGFSEIDRKTTNTQRINQFDVAGRRSNPRRYEVLSYIAVRTGEHLVSIRRTCTFLRDGNIYRQDWLAFPDRYTRFIIDLPEPAITDPHAAITLDTLTDTAE